MPTKPQEPAGREFAADRCLGAAKATAAASRNASGSPPNRPRFGRADQREARDLWGDASRHERHVGGGVDRLVDRLKNAGAGFNAPGVGEADADLPASR
jgi:hypothetical protein